MSLCLCGEILDAFMKDKITSAGNKGDKVRSDCFISIELKDSDGITIELNSKVDSLYGDHIDSLVTEILSFYDIKNAIINIDDSGALDYIIAARMEAAITQLIETRKEFLLELIPQNQYQTEKDRSRFSRLYLPGNSPQFFINSGLHKPNGIILDLEDSVSPNKKDEAKLLVRNALRQVDFYSAERMVRINQLPKGLDDLDYIIPHYPNLVLLPKCESADQINIVEERIKEIKDNCNLTYPVWLMPIIESALGVVKSYEIASSSEYVVALAIGLEDYTADIGAKRTIEAKESFFARSQIVNSAKAAGIQAIDSVFSDVADMEGLKETILESKALGFEGMGCIHPRQIPVIHDNYAPDEDEIDRAKQIVQAFDIAQQKGLGVVSLGSKMIDPPVVKKAHKIIDVAIITGKLDRNWK